MSRHGSRYVRIHHVCWLRCVRGVKRKIWRQLRYICLRLPALLPASAARHDHASRRLHLPVVAPPTPSSYCGPACSIRSLRTRLLHPPFVNPPASSARRGLADSVHRCGPAVPYACPGPVRLPCPPVAGHCLPHPSTLPQELHYIALLCLHVARASRACSSVTDWLLKNRVLLFHSPTSASLLC